jgi:hypothetical protein
MQLCLAALIPTIAQYLLPADLGFVALALLGLDSLPVLFFLPLQLTPPRLGTGVPAPVGLTAWVALAGCGAYMVAIVAVWAYFGVWEHQIGMSEQAIGTTAALSLGAQVLGAAAAGWLGPRLSSRPALLMTGTLQIAVVLGLLHWSAPAAQVALALAFGFLWLFALPLQTRLLIDVDPTRRAVLHLAAAQLTGSAAGPTLAGLFVTTGRVDGALWTGVTVLAVAVLMIGGPSTDRGPVASTDCAVDGLAFLHRLEDPDVLDRHRLDLQRVLVPGSRSASLPAVSEPFAFFEILVGRIGGDRLQRLVRTDSLVAADQHAVTRHAVDCDQTANIWSIGTTLKSV